jgi:signal transduction histidine kinase
VKFLDDLRAYLEWPYRPRPSPQRVAPHRGHLLDVLERLEKEGKDMAFIQEQLDSWDDERLQHFVHGMVRSLVGGLGHAARVDEIERLINIALDRELGLDSSTGSSAKDHEIDRLRRRAFAVATADDPRIPRYALELRAVRRAGYAQNITPIGKLVMELPDRDALRWLLAVEVVQSRGPRDEWRISADVAANLLQRSEGSHADWDDGSATPWPVAWGVLRRLSGLGMVKVDDPTDLDVRTYRLLPEGRILLEEIASGSETPFTLLARALLQDETTLTLGQFPAAAALARLEGAAAVTTRHARMVAHEIRNALVPVQITLEALYDDMALRGVGDLVSRRRPPIDGGIDRIFRFVQDVASIADLAGKPAELFDLGPAVQSAVAAMEQEFGRPIPIDQEAELPPVVGHRDRFVLSIANLLRNASQARTDPPVAIHVTTGAKNGAEVFVRVDDDGPGVPPEERARVFQVGFSRRPGGSGQGLAFVREVVEVEMAGRVLCEESPLGGARFVVRLPVGAKRSG